ncbi:MAG: RNA polymerase sigma factor, partial [Rickettsiales bacterium]
NELTIIERAKKGDGVAFRQLLDDHYNMMYRVAYRFTGQAQDAEDIAQEVCVGLTHKLQSFNGKSSFSTWLYRVVVNACHDYIKKRSNHRVLENNYIELENNEQSDKNEADKKIVWLYRMIASFEKSLKETAILVLTEDLSHAEAGKILGCAESTISWRMSEIRKHLKSAMGSYNDR